jgi:tetratricopeptide (TPR) repeat protein
LRSNYGLVLQKLGRADEAETTFRDVIERMKRATGPDHHDTLLAEGNLAMLRAQRGDLAEAELIFSGLLPRARAAMGNDNPVTFSFASKYGFVLSLQQKWAEAEPLLAEAYAAASALGLTSSQPGYSATYGICLANLNKPREALPILQQADHVARQLPQPDPQSLRRIAAAMAMVHEQLGQPDEAAKWREKAATRPAQTTPSKNP